MYTQAMVTLLSLTLMTFSSAVQSLTLQAQDKSVTLSSAQLVAASDTSHSMFAPFRRQTVLFEGYALSDFLQQHLEVTAQTVLITALDGYQITLEDVDQRPLMLVLKENGEPLTIRNHGPSRIIETDLGGRDARNISLFDDWIWMIQKIEVINE